MAKERKIYLHNEPPAEARERFFQAVAAAGSGDWGRNNSGRGGGGRITAASSLPAIRFPTTIRLPWTAMPWRPRTPLGRRKPALTAAGAGKAVPVDTGDLPRALTP